MKYLFSKKAQGTIEYLVIIAVVVVIALVVVSLLLNMNNSEQIDNTADKIHSASRGGIVIREGYSNATDDSLLVLRNNDPGVLTLKTIKTGNTTETYNTKIFSGQEQLINLNQMECKCEAGQSSKICEYTINYESEHGIPYTITQEVSAECLEEISTPKPPTEPQYTYSNIDCFDNTQDPIPICTLSDLNRIREDITANYKLMNDINASDTINWNGGAGWTPIGPTFPNYFTGDFDGQGFEIKNLFINYNNQAGLFNTIYTSTIQNIGLSDVNITGYDTVGALAASSTNSNIINSFVTGDISEVSEDFSIGVGGFFGGGSSTDINESYTNVNVTTNLSYAGGIAGYVSNLTLNDSYTTGTITGPLILGGIFGEGSATIRNSYSSINITGDFPSGGLFALESTSVQIINSFSTGNHTGNVDGIVPDITSNTTLTNTYTTNSDCGLDAGCTANQSLSSFYSTSHGVYTNSGSEWDFDNIWKSNSNALPTLRVFD
jgi:hypothetical protein